MQISVLISTGLYVLSCVIIFLWRGLIFFFSLLPTKGNIIYHWNLSKTFWGENDPSHVCIFPASVCFCCLGFPWWQWTKRSTVELFQQSQTQCLYREFLSLAQTHRPTAKKDKVNHCLCFLLASLQRSFTSRSTCISPGLMSVGLFCKERSKM